MKPAIIIKSYLRQIIQRINDAGRGCACRASYAARNESPFLIGRDCLAEQVCADVKTIISLNLTQIPASESEDVNALFKRIMRLLGSVNDQFASRCANAFLTHVLMRPVPRAFQSDQVRFRAAARQRAETLALVTDHFAKPAQHT